MTRLTSRCAVFVIACGVSAVPATPNRSGQETCESHLFSGPDSRLEPHIVGLLPKNGQTVVGFEVVNGQPLVAFPHSLVGYQEKGASELPIAETIKGLSYEKESRVLLQSDRGFLRLGDHGLEPAPELDSAIHGRLYGSGNPVSMEVRARQGVLQFIGRKDDGAAFPITAAKGAFRAASWNEQGLAAVVGDSLFLWQPGSKSVVRLLTDQGLAAARDVVAVGNQRAVVSLKNSVVLVTPEAITIIATLPSSRCRFQRGILYVLEESNGLIWSFHGLENLGTKAADSAFARGLLRDAAKSPGTSKIQLQEAARILGCKETGQAANPHASQEKPGQSKK